MTVVFSWSLLSVREGRLSYILSLKSYLTKFLTTEVILTHLSHLTSDRTVNHYLSHKVGGLPVPLLTNCTESKTI